MEGGAGAARIKRRGGGGGVPRGALAERRRPQLPAAAVRAEMGVFNDGVRGNDANV